MLMWGQPPSAVCLSGARLLFQPRAPQKRIWPVENLSIIKRRRVSVQRTSYQRLNYLCSSMAIRCGESLLLADSTYSTFAGRSPSLNRDSGRHWVETRAR